MHAVSDHAQSAAVLKVGFDAQFFPASVDLRSCLHMQASLAVPQAGKRTVLPSKRAPGPTHRAGLHHQVVLISSLILCLSADDLHIMIKGLTSAQGSEK